MFLYLGDWVHWSPHQNRPMASAEHSNGPEPEREAIKTLQCDGSGKTWNAKHVNTMKHNNQSFNVWTLKYKNVKYVNQSFNGSKNGATNFRTRNRWCFHLCSRIHKVHSETAPHGHHTTTSLTQTASWHLPFRSKSGSSRV